jgi:hypothetical protein
MLRVVIYESRKCAWLLSDGVELCEVDLQCSKVTICVDQKRGRYFKWSESVDADAARPIFHVGPVTWAAPILFTSAIAASPANMVVGCV